MGSFRKAIRYSKPSTEVDKKIKSLNEEMVKTGAFSIVEEQSTQIVEKINQKLETIPEEFKTDFIQYAENTSKNLNNVKKSLLKRVHHIELQKLNAGYSLGGNKFDVGLSDICEDIDKSIQRLQEEAIDGFTYIKKSSVNEGLLNEPPSTKILILLLH